MAADGRALPCASLHCCRCGMRESAAPSRTLPPLMSTPARRCGCAGRESLCSCWRSMRGAARAVGEGCTQGTCSCGPSHQRHAPSPLSLLIPHCRLPHPTCPRSQLQPKRKQKLVDRLKRERFRAVFDYLRRSDPSSLVNLLETVQVHREGGWAGRVGGWRGGRVRWKAAVPAGGGRVWWGVSEHPRSRLLPDPSCLPPSHSGRGVHGHHRPGGAGRHRVCGPPAGQGHRAAPGGRRPAGAVGRAGWGGTDGGWARACQGYLWLFCL